MSELVYQIALAHEHPLDDSYAPEGRHKYTSKPKQQSAEAIKAAFGAYAVVKHK